MRFLVHVRRRMRRRGRVRPHHYRVQSVHPYPHRIHIDIDIDISVAMACFLLNTGLDNDDDLLVLYMHASHVNVCRLPHMKTFETAKFIKNFGAGPPANIACIVIRMLVLI